MTKLSSAILFSCFILMSCVDAKLETETDSESINSQAGSTKSSSTEFKKLPNPYALNVMQAVYSQHGKTNILNPTHLYVRFLPQDSLQLKSLVYDYGFELFDHPLDIEIPEGVTYIDPTIPEGDFTWLYTTVKTGTNLSLPSDILYEVLEQCYIPAEDEEIVTTKGDGVNVEKAAFLKLGYTIETDPTTRAFMERPEGTLRVYNDDTGSLEPLKGVHVRCHTFVKWSNAFTDENGHYSMDAKFLFDPHYAVVFDNMKGFDIWGNWGPLARANYNMGWHSRKGHSCDIYTNSGAWPWCVTNNAGYDYYKQCEKTGIPKPPSNLKIWVFKGKYGSSASMMRRINNIVGWEIFYINMGAPSLLLNLIKKVLPDITIRSEGKGYRGTYEVVHHELSHASHFSQVGSAYWARYINYIIANGAYGNGTARDAKLCAIGEMWGYSMGYIYDHERYSSITPGKAYPGGEVTTDTDPAWIKPHIFWDLHRDNILTKRQLFDCLTTDVDTYDKLVAKMYSKYPNKAISIENAFVRHGITPNVQKPGSDDSYDTFYTNQTVFSSYIFSGNNILSENVTVLNNASLTLKGTQSVTIKGPFTVNVGGRFMMTAQ